MCAVPSIYKPHPAPPTEVGESSFVRHFGSVSDPRRQSHCQHSLHDILVIAICGVLCGADDWVAVATFGEAKEDWLRTFLDLPNGVPSHDTFSRVFSALSTEEFASAFRDWIASIATSTEGEVIAIDGKTLRRSFDRASGKAAIHMVSAWATGNGLALGQVKTDDKSNEITAIPELLELIRVKGCLVTIDAMGCQKKIARKIIDRGAHYLLAVKKNQKKLFERMSALVTCADVCKTWHTERRQHATLDKKHGREEHRRCVCVDVEGHLGKIAKDWPDLKSVVMVESTRVIGEEISSERRYYICSDPALDPERFLAAIRSHWGIENSLHWCLDVGFREDESRIRKGKGPANMAILRQTALNLLKSEKTAKVGIKNKRLKAGFDNRYLCRILGIGAR